MSIRRAKPYVTVDCDFADHHRFQSTKDLEASAGAWLRCLAYSRAQELDGIVKSSWVKRTFAKKQRRIDELVAVGLLRVREDGDYEIHAYAPRNQTRAMMETARSVSRDRIAAWRERRNDPKPKGGTHIAEGPKSAGTGIRSRPDATRIESGSSATDPSRPFEGLDPTPFVEKPEREEHIAESASLPSKHDGSRVTLYPRVSNALVPTSTSTSLNINKRSDKERNRKDKDIKRGVQRGDPAAGESVVSFESESDSNLAPNPSGRRPLPPSERAVSGPAWLAAFTAGITAATGRPCTAGRMYVATLERIVEQHAPARDAPRACDWIQDQATVFAKQWDGKHPAKGLTPDGLERWLNEGRRGPPVFGKPRIVQLLPEEWHDDDWSDLTDKEIQ